MISLTRWSIRGYRLKNKTIEKAFKKGWGISYGQLVAREFFKSRLNRVGLAFIIFLFVIAVLAPFLANDKPYVIKIDGDWHFPLLGALGPVDWAVFLAAAVGISLVYLMKRNQRKIAPMERAGVLWRQVGGGDILLFAGKARRDGL